MELRRYFELIRRRFILVVVAVIVGGLAGYFSTNRTPVYSATSTIYVGSLDLAANQQQLSLQAGLNEVVATFASMIPSPIIAQHAIEKEHVDRQAGAVAAATTTTVVTGTDLIDVTVSDGNPTVAKRLANGMARAFVSQIANYQSPTTNSSTQPGSVPNEPAYVFQEAVGASVSSNGEIRKVLLGCGLGLVIAIAAIFLLEYLDVTVKNPEEIERRLGLPVLGVVPLFGTLSIGPRPEHRG